MSARTASRALRACSSFLVICAGYWSSAKHIRYRGQDSVDTTFSIKMLVNCAHIWPVDLVQFQDDVAGAILFKVPSFGIVRVKCQNKTVSDTMLNKVKLTTASRQHGKVKLDLSVFPDNPPRLLTSSVPRAAISLFPSNCFRAFPAIFSRCKSLSGG